MGEDFDSFSSKMISPEAEVLIKYATENIFKKSSIGRSVDKSFKLLKEGIPIYRYLNNDDIKAIAAYLEKSGYPVVKSIDLKTKKPTEFINAKDTVLNFIYSGHIEAIRKVLKNFKVDGGILNGVKFQQKRQSQEESDFDDSEFLEEPGESRGPSYKNTLTKLARYATDIIELREETGFEYALRRKDKDYDEITIVKSPKLKLELLDELEDVSKRAGAIRILGQMLGINQSIKADPESLNKYFENLEVFYNKRIVEVGYPAIKVYTSDFQFLNKAISEDILKNGFNARKFGLDEEYKNTAVSLFNALKYDINIFDVIANSLHFFEMYKAAIYAESAINNSAKKLRITNKLVDKVRDIGIIPNLKVDGVETNFKGNLPKNVYTRLSSISTDILNIRFFDEKNIRVKLRNGDFEYDAKLERSEILGDTRNIGLNTYSGRKTFVEWFENKVIPDLKNGMIRNTEGVYNLEPSENLLSNEFVRSLKLIIDEDRNTKIRYVKYTLPIKMTQAKTLDEKMMFDTYSEHFRNLGSTTYDGQSVSDLFYLYNLIVNGNNVNNDSLTRIFESNFNYVLDSSKIKMHLRYIGDLDYNESGDTYSYLNYISPEVLVAAGVYSDITTDELNNKTKKPLSIVRSYSKDYNGVTKYSYFKGEVNRGDGKFGYQRIEMKDEFINKYINTIDVNNGLNGIFYGPYGEIKQKVASNLITYKINCE